MPQVIERIMVCPVCDGKVQRCESGKLECIDCGTTFKADMESDLEKVIYTNS